MASKFRFKNADGTTVDFEDYYVRADYFRSGNLWSSGINSLGGLGDNTSTNRSSPVQTVAGGTNWKQVACGYHTAAIKTEGTLWTWGRGLNGQLGNNTATTTLSPVQTVAFGTNWKQVACGASHTAAIQTDGTLWTWGRNSQIGPTRPAGQLGDNTAIDKSSPVQTVTGGTNWKQVACGPYHTAAIKTDGTLWLFGANDNFASGKLGDNTVISKSSPVQTVAGGTNWMQVTCASSITSAIKTDGTLWCWGYNSSGQIGDNTATSKSSPVQTITFGTNWKQVSCGDNHVAAIKTNGTLWLWGYNASGQLGDNTATSRSSPVQTVAFGTNWKQVSCGGDTTAAIKTDGTLWCWGYNLYGGLGDNTIVNKSSPVQTVTFGTIWQQVSCDTYHTAAIQYQDEYQ